VDQGVVGGAETDEQLFPGDAWPAVMNVDTPATFPFSAHPAGVAVAFEDMAAPSAEMEQVMPLGGVTAVAEASYKRCRGSAGPAP
jgi:hypothetical protein